MKRILKRNRKKTSIKSTAERLRLTFFRSNTNMYAQVINDQEHKTVVSSSTIKSDDKNNVSSAESLAVDLSKKCKEQGIDKLVFDRGRYVVRGRIRRFLEVLNENGVKI